MELTNESNYHTVTCNFGHEYRAYMVGGILDGNRWTRSLTDDCLICRITYFAQQRDPSIICLDNSYITGQTKFNLQCGKGHKYTACVRTCRVGCKCCSIINIARAKHNADESELLLESNAVYLHEDSRLRWHCNKPKHNPNCDDPICRELGGPLSKMEHAPHCTNMIPCDQDFYATPRMIKYETGVYSCKNDHNWVGIKSQVLASIRIFEITFNDRFDDSIDVPILVTGYNSRLNVAFIHKYDRVSNNNIETTVRQCNLLGIKLIILNGTKKTSQLTTQIISKLVELGILDTPVERTVIEVRKKMRAMNKEHKLFANRI